MILICVLSIPLLGNAQDLTNWQVGINVTPFVFTRFSPDFWPEKQGNDYPNGLGLGITLEKKDEFEWVDLFEENKSKAQILKQEIDRTDKEINAMVYELYGLTDEEIEIVEGR